MLPDATVGTKLNICLLLCIHSFKLFYKLLRVTWSGIIEVKHILECCNAHRYGQIYY